MESRDAKAASPRPGRDRRAVNVGSGERKASLVGGAALALSGAASITRKRYLPGLAMMLAGGIFLYRGKTGHCDLYQALGVDTVNSGDSGLRVEKILTVNRPPQQVYEFWHDLENLPKFMEHLESVRVTGDKSSHWKARGPAGVTLEWDAEIIDDVPEQISWHSVGDAALPNKGTVAFKAAPGERGTEVRVTIDYYPPGGSAGRAAAKLLQLLTAQRLEEDLKRFKQILETGEIATSERL